MRSTEGSNRVSDIVLERLPNTMLLLTTSLLITASIGVAVGVWLSTRVGSRIDRFVSWASAVSYALPGWWTGILLILILGFGLRLLPSGGMFSSPPPTDQLGRLVDLLYHAILPILTLVLVSIGPSIYVVRTMTLNGRPGRPRDAGPRQGDARAASWPGATSCGSRRHPS